MDTTANVKKITVVGVMTALNIVIARVFLIPVPMTKGFLNLCDAGIVLIALLYGANYGGLVGALSGFLLDLLAGAPQYMLFSLVIHGFEGWVFGKVIEKEKTPGRLVLAVVLATVIVSCGYFACETFLFKFSTAIIGFPMNILQAIVGSLVGIVLYSQLRKVIH
ncbi:ECF transporter S component [Ligilactobacillus saerimneri]|uniref:ECF transporter S component n=1 Tax=Ligilactobacillus saerimneri TaxID=228229 RepID=UPI0024B23943|nr:ECF transporter S component [Ligilactobacillus saerimneri]MDI9206667.1 ECF transporter S component [Ligilactobacillus saerimneri]